MTIIIIIIITIIIIIIITLSVIIIINHPLGSTELLYLPRTIGGQGMKSLEA